MSDTPESSSDAAEESARRKNGVARFVGGMVRGTVRAVLLIVVPLLVAVVGVEMYIASGKVVSSENAYVKAEKVAVSSDVAGRVSELNVKPHQRVQTGEILFVLDQRPFEIELARAEAQLGVVENEIRGYRSVYRMEVATLEMATDDLGYFQREHDRQKKLSSGGIVSKARFDQAQHDLQQARQRISGIREQIGNALTRLGGDPDLPVESHPSYLEALAERDASMLQLELTVVRAAESGVIGSIELQVGEYVEDGQPVFSIVRDDSVWVTANLKETQLTHVEIGQTVSIIADTYPDKNFSAVVESIAPATGAEFSLLPPQNASGNWVKVVQRIPVRLKILDDQGNTPLRAGMSVTAEITTGHEREIPDVLRQAMAWVEAGKARIQP
jgi:membrane fusion protein, multidrug efflux system